MIPAVRHHLRQARTRTAAVRLLTTASLLLGLAQSPSAANQP